MSDDFSVRVSRRGQNAIRAKDYQTIFNSETPSIHPIKQDLVRAGSTPGQLFNHGLGHNPFFLVYRKGDDNGIVPTHATGAASYQLNDTREVFSCTPENFKLKESGYGASGGTLADYYYVIFDVDIGQEFTSSIGVPGDREAGRKIDNDFQFKVSERSAINSRDPRNYMVNTDYQPILLHMVRHWYKPENVFEEFKIRHELGYPPMFHIYARHLGDRENSYDMVSIGPAGGLINYVRADDVYVTVGATFPFERLIIVILRDPLL